MSQGVTNGGGSSLSGGTDNRIVRWDGTTAVQSSAIGLSDTNTEGSVDFTISGTQYMRVRGGTSIGDVGITATQNLAAFTVKPGANVTNIGGTTVASSASTITGSSTTYLETLGPLDRISLSSSAATYRHVRSIPTNTSLTVEGTLGNGALQTINRRRAIQTWFDSTNGFVGGITDYGSFLIGNPDTASVYLSNKLIGALTVNRPAQSATIASFHSVDVWKAHINTNGLYKFVYGDNNSDEQRGVPAVIVTDKQQLGSGGAGGLVALGSYSIPGNTFLNQGDVLQAVICGTCDGGISGVTFKAELGGNTLFSQAVGNLASIRDWRMTIEIMMDETGSFKSMVSIIATRASSQGECFSEYATNSFNETSSNDLIIYADDGGSGQVYQEFAFIKWLPSSDS